MHTCPKILHSLWLMALCQTAEYGCVAPEIYFIAIFGAPKVHYVIILNTYSVLVLVRSLFNSVQSVVFYKSELAIRLYFWVITALWPPLDHFCAPAPRFYSFSAPKISAKTAVLCSLGIIDCCIFYSKWLLIIMMYFIMFSMIWYITVTF